MAPRSALRFAFSLLACGALLALTRPLTAQGVIVNTTSRAAVAMGGNLPLSDDAVRAMVQAHFPEALDSDADAPHAVLLVVDANGEYVSGKASKATVVTPNAEGENGMRTFVIRDSSGAAGEVTVNGASVMVRREGAVAAAGTVGSVNGAGGVFVISRSGDGEPANGILGSGYTMADVASIGFKRFTAGQLGNAVVVVSVLKLK